MICGHCDQAINPGEPYTEHPIDAPSLAGTTVYWHTERCPEVPSQTAPASGRR